MKVANDILIPELARLLEEQKDVRFTPSGVSMRPFIEGDRDSVVLSPLTREPRIGDILLACVTNHKSPSTYVLHRLIRIEGEQFILMGDGNLTGEEHCRREELIGRVTAIEAPSGRRKLLTRGRIWFYLKPFRSFLLKIYRHTYFKLY